MLTNLIEDRAAIALWSGGVTSLKVADIIEETADAKTFRLVGEKPHLFSYRPGQFVTLVLTIDGEYIERSYSVSSGPFPAACSQIGVGNAYPAVVCRTGCASVSCWGSG